MLQVRKMAKVCIIDDDEMFCDMLSDMVKRQGHEASTANTIQEGLKKVTTADYDVDVVFLDVRLPDGNGLDLLPVIRKTASNPEVIIITGAGDPDGAELAITCGAWDYIEKSSPLKAIVLSLNRAIQYREEKRSHAQPVILKRDEIVGSSPKIMDCLDFVAQSAVSDANVLIAGATGTGKELFARAIHNNSRRAEGNFVVVDCAALPDTLVESILLGHKKGAFTGADQDSEGLFKQADKGTIFLDEIGELSLSNQKAFLRVLQEQKFRPVGSKEEVKSDFRVVAASNRNLEQMVQEKTFRQDLFFRLKSLELHLPPLRERPEDIKDLVNSRISESCDRYGLGLKGVSADYYDVLFNYDWPGNVRELFNAVDSSVSASKNEPTIFPMHLPSGIRIRVAKKTLSSTPKMKGTYSKEISTSHNISPLREYRDSMDKEYLQELMHLTGGNIKEAYSISGLSRSRLYALLQKHNLTTNSSQ
jgi:two-component system NtrC family response regulator